ncbi:MAG TPA: SWIM zinc finger family protein [Pirellulales bacterium]|nr:SWIM zinc finger family protein [Pirellulales bacterium]
MAEHGPLLTQLRATLAALDDDALAAMANKGLLRRARKDLEQASGEILESGDDGLRVRLGGETVVVPANPVQARCSCPAGGVCRHVLAALVFLREKLPAGPPEEGAFPSAAGPAAHMLADLDDEALRRWAGKPLLRRATKALAEGLQAELDERATLVVRFPARNIVCRLVPGAGLAGWLCSCPADGVCEHRVAAVLAWQVAHGRRTIDVEAAVLPAADEAPRTREEVLASVREVLGEMFGVGLARLSTASNQRLQTLAVSCHGVQLPRLERWLAVLAEETGRSLRRDAQASTARLLERGARVWALSVALARPTARLVGQHRTRYEPVGRVSLVGVGAERWKSKSGFVGLTVYFWDESLGDWCTWTEARPVGVPGFDPVKRYQAYGPWDGCSSPDRSSRSRLALTGAWRNRGGRLSGRPSVRATVVGESDPRQLPAANDWSQLGERARRLFGGGLGERNEQDELVLLRPSAWLSGQYDPVRQELVCLIFDDKQRPLPVVLPFTPETASGVRTLEHHDAAAAYGLFGRLRLTAGKLSVEPISLFAEGGIVHLTLDEAGSAAQAERAPAVKASLPSTTDDADEASPFDETAAEDPSVVGTSTPLGIFLSSIEAELERVAEAGTSARRDLAPLEQAAEKLRALGLEIAAGAVGKLVEKLRLAPQARGLGRQKEAAAALLRAAYVVRLAIVEEALAVATAGLA